MGDLQKYMNTRYNPNNSNTPVAKHHAMPINYIDQPMVSPDGLLYSGKTYRIIQINLTLLTACKVFPKERKLFRFSVLYSNCRSIVPNEVCKRIEKKTINLNTML